MDKRTRVILLGIWGMVPLLLSIILDWLIARSGINGLDFVEKTAPMAMSFVVIYLWHKLGDNAIRQKLPFMPSLAMITLPSVVFMALGVKAFFAPIGCVCSFLLDKLPISGIAYNIAWHIMVFLLPVMCFVIGYHNRYVDLLDLKLLLAVVMFFPFAGALLTIFPPSWHIEGAGGFLYGLFGGHGYLLGYLLYIMVPYKLFKIITYR